MTRTMTANASLSSVTRRLASIDAFRAITMLLMIFVNDLELDEKVPRWLEHAKEGEKIICGSWPIRYSRLFFLS